MEYITGIEQYAGIEKTALTLGKFDGLHKGHQKLIDKICAYSGENCKSVLCAFDMHRESLMTKQERRSHLEGKIDCLIEYPFTKELREMEAEVFIKNILCEKLHAAHIVVGTDFAFGHEKRGNTEMLKMFSEKGGYTLDVIEKERYDHDQQYLYQRCPFTRQCNSCGRASRISVWSNRNCSAWQTTGADARLSYNECRA